MGRLDRQQRLRHLNCGSCRHALAVPFTGPRRRWLGSGRRRGRGYEACLRRSQHGKVQQHRHAGQTQQGNAAGWAFSATCIVTLAAPAAA